MQTPELQKEHEWLQRLVGEWTFEHECSMGPDQPPMKSTGMESVRSLGAIYESTLPANEIAVQETAA